jgi:hypothetical protein
MGKGKIENNREHGSQNEWDETKVKGHARQRCHGLLWLREGVEMCDWFETVWNSTKASVR